MQQFNQFSHDSDFNGIRIIDLCDTGANTLALIFEAMHGNWVLRVLLNLQNNEFVCV